MAMQNSHTVRHGVEKRLFRLTGVEIGAYGATLSTHWWFLAVCGQTLNDVTLDALARSD